MAGAVARIEGELIGRRQGRSAPAGPRRPHVPDAGDVAGLTTVICVSLLTTKSLAAVPPKSTSVDVVEAGAGEGDERRRRVVPLPLVTSSAGQQRGSGCDGEAVGGRGGGRAAEGGDE